MLYSAFPTSIFVNADGLITGRHSGLLSYDEMVRFVEGALADDPVIAQGPFEMNVRRLIEEAGLAPYLTEINEDRAELVIDLGDDIDAIELVISNYGWPDEDFSEVLLEFAITVPSVLASDLGPRVLDLLESNAYYVFGAWALRDGSLVLIDNYIGRMLDGETFFEICYALVESVVDVLEHESLTT